MVLPYYCATSLAVVAMSMLALVSCQSMSCHIDYPDPPPSTSSASPEEIEAVFDLMNGLAAQNYILVCSQLALIQQYIATCLLLLNLVHIFDDPDQILCCFF